MLYDAYMIYKGIMAKEITNDKNDKYWDCDCPTDYIHLKSKGNYCPRCKTFLSYHCPDSRTCEIKSLYNPKKDCAMKKSEVISATTFQLKHAPRDKSRIPFKCRFDVGDYVEVMQAYGTIVALDESTGNCKVEMEING